MMATKENEVIDSQIIAENVGFLEHCFDNSFSLETSLLTVKEYASQAENHVFQHNVKSCKSIKGFSHTKTSPHTTTLMVSHVNAQASLQDVNLISNDLKAWGLPAEITKKYKERGITEMFDWQVTCLGNPKVLMDARNLVYSAPTSAGKTLVAEILTIKTILERQKKVIMILPFVSIVREKMFYLQDILSSSGIRVEGFMGAQSPPGGLQAIHLAICTIEKANSLVNRLLDEGNISELGAVIVDELHLLGDPHRGYILELLLTKIKYVSSKLDDVQIQIVGMSATLPNLSILAEWLDAELYITDFRPIPLDEFCLVGHKYFDKNGEFIADIEKESARENDYVLKICLDTIKDGCSVLIFCMTKNRCEHLAQSIASSFYKLGCSGTEVGLILRSQLRSENIFEMLEQLKNCPVGLDQILKNTISFGVAYHHAGLTFDERDIIEGGFKSGAIRVLVATSTLSSGVNLPARRVIIRSPVFQRQPINILTYKQMIGRAGRMGRDLKGESILICTESEKNVGFELMMGALDPVKSCIESEDKYMRAVLEMIASQNMCTEKELDLYSKCTLLFTEKSVNLSQNFLLKNTLKELTNYELVRVQTDSDQNYYVATPLGKACLSSSMAPNDGLSLFCELQRARQCLVLETDLHLIYLVTPYSVSSQWGDIDWLHLLTLWESLTKAMKRVGELVGIQESFIIRCLRGANKLNNVQTKMSIHKRFYTALALQDLVNEVPLSEVAHKFQCARGFLQSLQQAAATFAGMVTAFCRQLGWKNMEMLISQFQDRLHFGIHSELVELMKLQSLNGIRARTLFDYGFESISSIASADVNAIENALLKTVPFQSEKGREGDDIDDVRKRNKIKNIWITGCCGMTIREAADNLIAEARKYLEHEIGVAEIKWNTNSHHGKNSQNMTNANMENDSSVKNYECNKPKFISQSIVTEQETDSQKKYFKDTLKTEVIACKNIEKSGLVEIKSDNEMNCKTVQDDIAKIEKCTEESTVIVNDDVDIDCNPQLTVKSGEDLCIEKEDCSEWDTLNLNDAAIENITKLRTSSVSSPNISFCEIKKEEGSPKQNNVSPKFKSINDVSLFSSDGDNSSLFEESLPIDLISSKLYNGVDSKTKISTNMKDTTVDFINPDSNTILNAFQTTLIESEEENIKLIYEDDYKIHEKELEVGLDESDDFIITQEIAGTSINNIFISPLKRQAESGNDVCLQPLPKKVKIKQTSHQKTQFNMSAPKINMSESKILTVEINKAKFNCFILRKNDIAMNFHILPNIQEAYIYVDTSGIQMNSNEVIGSNIFKQDPDRKNKTNNAVNAIKRIVVYHDDVCILLDLMSSNDVSIQDKLSDWLQKKSLKLKVMSLKTVYIDVKRHLGIDMPLPVIDISLVEWLLNSDEKTSHATHLIKKYCDIDLDKSSIKINDREKKYKGLDVVEELCINAWCLWAIAEKQEKHLLAQYATAQDTLHIEIQVSKILLDCEYYGICVDKQLASQLLIDVKKSQETLQKKAYKICGYHFNFNSSKDVAKVLGIYKGRKVSTKKSVLTSHNSPMSSIVIFWRKLNSILTKTLYPLTEKACIYSTGDRINPTYTMYTCTGRVSMHEPNLQNVPRTFSIPMHYLTLEDVTTDEVVEFNCRNIFRATPGHVLVSADYCQLEMRILTHYSEDPVLMKIMISDVDVFKSIAASWSNVPEEEVDEDLRQKAKQLCYGILYGMGNRTLAQHLDVTELEAAMFMDSFYKTYPAIKTFTHNVIEDCRKRGYAETLMKRRRFLPDIKSTTISKKSAAERQAVNTTIQGSAADIAKAAMCAIDNKTRRDANKPRLILQMHDELIYEVPDCNKQRFIRTIKQVMEGTVSLKVPLPVKVKAGPTWGTLQEV